MRRALLFFPALFLACTSDPDPIEPPDSGQVVTDAGVPLPDAEVFPDAETFPDAEVDAGVVDVDTPITERFRPIAEMFDQQRRTFGAPGAAMLILENGEITFARGFGSKHPDREDPVHSTTLFRIGSVNKMLTSAALLQLVGANMLDLEAPITTPLPGLSFARDPSWAPNIRVKHLLTHAGAFYDYTVFQVPPAQQEDAALESFLMGDFADNIWLMAPPGRMFNYSNPNFYFAGLIVEKLSGLSYRQAMRDRLFAPLGMDRTFFLGSEVIADGDYAFASSTDQMGRPIVVAPDTYDNAWARPAGFAFSSVRDLAKFVLFLEQGNTAVLSDDLRMAMQSPQIAEKTLFDLDHYGYGISVYEGTWFGGDNEFRRVRFINHGGAIAGYSAEITYVPSLRFGMVTLASTDGAYFGQTFVTALRALTTLPPAEPGPEFTPDPSEWARYAGTYLDPYNVGTVIVRAHTSSITVSMPELDRMAIPYVPRLEPYSPDNFILNVQNFQLPLTFILDDQGDAEYLRTRPFVARKSAMVRGGLTRPAALNREKFLELVRDEARRNYLLLPPR